MNRQQTGFSPKRMHLAFLSISRLEYYEREMPEKMTIRLSINKKCRKGSQEAGKKRQRNKPYLVPVFSTNNFTT
jgi:hypothetical protein